MPTTRFTYSGDPTNSSRDEVRFLIGDTDRNRVLFDDREIDYQLGKTPNSRLAGAELLEVKSREFASKADIRVGDVSKSFSKAAETMKECARQLRDDALRRAKPFFGGLTTQGKVDLANDTSATQPQFAIGMDDNPFSAQLHQDVASLIRLVGLGGI